MQPPASAFFHLGGSIPHSAKSYVTRSADEQYYQSLLAGKFTYVLNPRQTGKSSLTVRAMARLQAQSVHCIPLGLGLIVTESLTKEQFYASLLSFIAHRLKLSISVGNWWRNYSEVPLLEKVHLFIEEQVLQQIQGKIIVFMDEIDTLLSLQFSCQEFFQFLSQCYQARHRNSLYHNLNFSIIGSSNFLEVVFGNQGHLFKDGELIELPNFTPSEAQILVEGLTPLIANAPETLDLILQWSGGQPFLTQKLCLLVQKEAQKSSSLKRFTPSDIEKIVHEKMIQQWEIQDEPEHLRTIRDRILKHSGDRKATLELYQRVLAGEKIPFQIHLNHVHLCLSGLVQKPDGYFQPNNLIYQTIFNPDWTQEQLKRMDNR